jgi:ABC-type glycerol-3-phosphate transport system permease component
MTNNVKVRPAAAISSERSARVRRTRARQNPGHSALRLAGYVTLSLVSLASIAPLLWMISTSLRPQSEVFSGSILPGHLQFDAYGYIWSALGIGKYYGNSIYVTGLTVVAVVAVSSLAGYAFAILPVPGKRVLFSILMGALLIPAALILVPSFLELRDLGMINTRTGLALVHIGTSVPFATYLMRTFFESVPADLRDAGKLDGASEFRIFRSIALPLCLPGLVTVAIFQVMFTWNDLMLSNGLIQNQDLQTLQPALYTLVGAHSTNWPALTAALTVAAAPIVILFIALQRFFVAGLLVGSVKG